MRQALTVTAFSLLTLGCSGSGSDDLSKGLTGAALDGALAIDSATSSHSADGGAVGDSDAGDTTDASSAPDSAPDDAAAAEDGGTAAGPRRTASTGLVAVFQMGIAFDAQDAVVLMDVEAVHPTADPSASAVQIAFRRLSQGVWSEAAAPVALGAMVTLTPYQQSYSCVGFALDRNSAPSYVALSADQTSYSVQRFTGSAWESIGPSLPQPTRNAVGGGCVTSPKLAFDGNNRPIVAYDMGNSTNGKALSVVRFEGDAWAGLGPNGGVVTSQFGLTSYAMALDRAGLPVVVWGMTGTQSANSYVVRYVDSPAPAWQGVGSASGLLPTAPGNAYSDLWGPSIALDSHDHPRVAAGTEGATPAHDTVVAFAFDGDVWSTSDQHGSPYGYSQSQTLWQVALLVDSGDTATLLWSESGQPSATFHAESWSAAGWQGVGSVTGVIDDPNIYATPNTLRTVGIVRAAADSHGNAAIAYYQYDVDASAYRVGVSSPTRVSAP